MGPGEEPDRKLLAGLHRGEGVLCLSSGTGAGLRRVQILWQIYMLTLLLKDSLPGKQTRASTASRIPIWVFFFN